MTPVGVALIVGGITTLIVFRAALFRSARTDQRVAEHGETRRRADSPGADGTSSGAGDTSSGAGRGGEAPSRQRRRGRAGSTARTKARTAPAASQEDGTGPDAVVPAPRGGRRADPAAAEPAAPAPRGHADPARPGRSRLEADRAGRTGPGSRRLWPTSGTPEPDVDAEESGVGTAPADDERPDRSLFGRLVELDEDGAPAPVGDASPTDLRLASLGRADDPGEPADRAGDPELDIDQDLDRAADVVDPADRSHALDLPGLGLLGRQSPDGGYDADLSGPFDSVAGTEGTGTFSGLFADASLEDADETGFVPVPDEAAGPTWAERADRRYGDRVEGWVRPEYPDEPVAGEYWTPAPVHSYEAEYGWPTPVERLPEVPPYPPSSGFDVPVEIETEPTRPVPQWPPARPDDRIELPRSWSHRGGGTGPAFRTAVDRGGPVGLRPVADLPIEDHGRESGADSAAISHSTGTAEGITAFSEGAAHPLRDGDLGESADPVSVDDVAEVDDLAAESGPANSPAGRFPSDAKLPAGRFGDDAVAPAPEVTGRRRFDEPAPAADDRVFLGADGLMLAPNPHVHEDETGRPGSSRGAQAARRLAESPARDAPTGGTEHAGARKDRRTANANRVPVRRGPTTDQSGPYAAREESLEGPIWTVPDLPEAAMPDLTWSPEEAQDDTRRSRRPAVMVRRRRGAGSEATQALPPVEPARPDQPRARPRPRPRPGAGQPEPRSTVYVSRHAAEPS